MKSAKDIANFVTRVVTGIVFGFVFWWVYFFLPPAYFTGLLALVAAIIIVFEWKNLYDPHTLWFWFFLPIYPLLPFLLLIHISCVSEYHVLLLYLFVLAFTHDTGAYIVGSVVGRHKIWPVVSPKKTWEGFLGGYISAVIAFYAVACSRNGELSLLFMLAISFIACVLFVIGDLVESRLKRRAGVKDSGHLLPGHGGFLDRFDGIIFAAFFVYVTKDYLILFLK